MSKSWLEPSSWTRDPHSKVLVPVHSKRPAPNLPTIGESITMVQMKFLAVVTVNVVAAAAVVVVGRVAVALKVSWQETGGAKSKPMRSNLGSRS